MSDSERSWPVGSLKSSLGYNSPRSTITIEIRATQESIESPMMTIADCPRARRSWIPVDWTDLDPNIRLPQCASFYRIDCAYSVDPKWFLKSKIINSPQSLQFLIF